VTYPDFAEALQARICANLEAEKIAHTPRNRRNVDEGDRGHVVEIHIAVAEESAAQAEALEQRRQEADRAAKKITELERQIVSLQEAIAKAEALGEQQHQELQRSDKRADRLVAELIEITGEFVEMSKQIREQTAAMDRLRAELEDYRLGS
jgi:uncharacterized coiled-coil DUF342 family protein